jgi:hypothetical protein
MVTLFVWFLFGFCLLFACLCIHFMELKCQFFDGGAPAVFFRYRKNARRLSIPAQALFDLDQAAVIGLSQDQPGITGDYRTLPCAIQ